MITSILNEIGVLRGSLDYNIDRRNSNRYALLINENDNGRTAYCFSTSIYNINSKKLVSLRFKQTDKVFHHIGSNAEIVICKKEIIMKNHYGELRISGEFDAIRLHDGSLVINNGEIIPTLNGIMFKVKNNFILRFTYNTSFMQTKINSKCFAFMSEKFTPFATFSAIGSIGTNGKIISSARISHKKIDDKSHTVTINSYSLASDTIYFEINMYEPKLFQDTTVESKNPKENNAFGGTAFIGNTEAFGETWLYLRPDFSKISQFNGHPLKRIILHIPKLNRTNSELSVFSPKARFCSFGSTWENKISYTDSILTSISNDNYYSIDVTSHMTDRYEKKLIKTEGLILKLSNKNGFAAISTGDCYAMPQILEINYRK